MVSIFVHNNDSQVVLVQSKVQRGSYSSKSPADYNYVLFEHIDILTQFDFLNKPIYHLGGHLSKAGCEVFNVIVAKTLSTALTLFVFYYSFKWLRGGSAEFKSLLGITNDISQFVAALFASTVVISAFGWLGSKIERAPKIGSTWAILSALNLSASILIPEAYTRVHLSWVLLAIGFVGFIFGGLTASKYAEANNAHVFVGWIAVFTEVIVIIIGIAVIFFIMTPSPESL